MDVVVSVPPYPAIDNPVAAADARRHRAEKLHGSGTVYESKAASTPGTAQGGSGSSNPPPTGRFGNGEQEQRWRRCEELGRGAHGIVYRALLLDTNESIAVKQIQTSGMGASELQVKPAGKLAFLELALSASMCAYDS